MTYSEKLKDPRWQKRRLELLESAEWKCRDCGESSKTLHVHHGFYKRKTDPWDYPDWSMAVLCKDCHSSAQSEMESLHEMVATLSPEEQSELIVLLDAMNRSGAQFVKLCNTIARSVSKASSVVIVEGGTAWLMNGALLASAHKAFDLTKNGTPK